MKSRQLILAIAIIIVYVFSSCSKGEKVVIQKYEDGKPFIVRYMKKIDGNKMAVYQENFYPDGTLRLKGDLMGENNRKGIWSFYQADGTLFAKADFNDRKEGVWQIYFDKDSVLVNKTDTLMAVAFSDEGTPVSIKVKKGQQEVFYRFFNSFKLMERVNLKGNVPNGESMSWFENGNINSIHYYKDGMQDSVYTVYSQNGNKIISGNFVNGVKTGKWEYFSSEGKPLGTEIYDTDGTILMDKKVSQGLKYFTSKSED